MAEDRSLHGYPKKKLVTETKKFLRSYGVRPQPLGRLWLMTWRWASKVANSYALKPHWPSPSEVAAQYMTLLLADIRNDRLLRLSARSKDHVTPEVAAFIGMKAAPALPVAPVTPRRLPAAPAPTEVIADAELVRAHDDGPAAAPA